MEAGDRVFIYHSGGQSAITGLAEVISSPRPDQNEPKSVVVDFGYVLELTPPTTLGEIKQSKLFDDWTLVRQSRLSTMAAPEAFVEWMRRRYPGVDL
jgi:predicted RNA-binding protein with PUA-like domain